MSTSGSVNLFVLCSSCGEQIGLRLIARGRRLSKLPHQFSAKCPACGTKSAYQKRDLYVGSVANVRQAVPPR
jgi:DNA-directed RNA polymerase subunit RPC12/RpoP